MDGDIHSKLKQAVADYDMPAVAEQLLKAHPPLILAGITAAGKEAVSKRLEQISDYRQITTHTTRPPRPGEQDGKDYWFVGESEMLELLERKAMIEVKVLHGQQISSSSIAAYQEVLSVGKKPLAEVDVQGTQELIKHLPNARPIFLLPPSLEVWLQRLGDRGPMSHIERLRRFASAVNEIEAALDNQRFILVINNEINQTAEQIVRKSFNPRQQEESRQLAKLLLENIHKLN